MGGGISINDSTLLKRHGHGDHDSCNKEWKILLTKEELIKKYTEIDGVTISDPRHLELRSIKLHQLLKFDFLCVYILI